MFCYSHILYFRTFATKVVDEFTRDFHSAVCVIGGIVEVPMVPELKHMNVSPCHAM
jgi:hypothetical protein